MERLTDTLALSVLILFRDRLTVMSKLRTFTFPLPISVFRNFNATHYNTRTLFFFGEGFSFVRVTITPCRSSSSPRQPLAAWTRTAKTVYWNITRSSSMCCHSVDVVATSIDPLFQKTVVRVVIQHLDLVAIGVHQVALSAGVGLRNEGISSIVTQSYVVSHNSERTPSSEVLQDSEVGLMQRHSHSTMAEKSV